MSTGQWNDGGTGDWSTPSATPLTSQPANTFGGPARSPRTSSPSGPQGGVFGAPSPLGGADESMAPGRPPLVLLAIAAALGAGGLILGLLVGPSQLAIIGWLLAGPAAFTVVAYFSFRDTACRGKGLYLESGATKPLHVLALLLAFAGVAVCAVQFAFWVGRL